MSFLSDRVRNVKPSVTLAITAKAKKMRAEGIDVIGFGAGEPDFDTPAHIKEAAVRAIESGFTKYTPVGGTDELKQVIADRLRKDRGLEYEASQVLVSCGAKHSLYNIFQAVIDPGDEVVIPAPYWVSYPEMVVLAGGRPVVVNCSEGEGFKMTPERFRKAVTSRTKAVIINSPSNPTGSAYSAAELEGLAQVAVEKGILVISDEIYDRIVYGRFKVVSIASLGEEIKRLTMVVNGVSKAYSMTGWRIGYAAGDPEIIGAMNRIQAQSTSNPTSISQAAALEALAGPQDVVEEMVSRFEERKDYVVERLNSIEGVRCFDPQGSFYAFPNVSSYFGAVGTSGVIGGSVDLSAYLLEEAKVAVVPGDAFGADGYIRISYATSMENLEQGFDRIEKALKKLQPAAGSPVEK